MTTPDYQELLQLREENAKQQQEIVGLKNQLLEAIEGNKALSQQLSDLQEKLDRLLLQLEKRNKKEFGRKTERHNPRQAPQGGTKDRDQAKPQNRKNANHKKNINLQNLPKEPRHHKVAPEHIKCPTCQIDTDVIAQKLTSQLERLQHSLVSLQHFQEVRACPKCKQYIVTASKPDPPVPGVIAGPHLL